MTALIKAKEATIASETRIESLFHDVLDQVHALNSRLLDLHEAISASQPIASGSVCLEFYPCGTRCNGCPHPRWVQYHVLINPEKQTYYTKAVNLDAVNRDPVRALPRKTEHYSTTVALIREAKELLRKRSNLLTAIRALRHAAQ